MKIIADAELINYRIALQQEMYRANNDLCVTMQDLRDKSHKGKKLSDQDLHCLRNQLELVASMYFELEFGNFFSKQTKSFQDKVINNLTKNYFEHIFDAEIEDIGTFTMMQGYDDMETELNKQIKASQNGS